ncbi:hydrogenase iron-sulfur subunit [Desulfogranum japonicum]|uniref:hydrogenase iron-sulfur subunit n=1 Tax=Desulfogranum japonicum TaxID=231447 RepID=UPI00041E8992|nr:hydrogenase iron-sulfur subunit [Desulfogranum japonicum]
MENEIKIIAFCCNWCSYAAADLAGISRLQYPCSVRIIRVMCSGMVHPDMVIHALNQGADGVMLLGCLLGECHYQDGNYKALARAEVIEEVLDDLGYEEERFTIAWLSSAEQDKLVEAINQMHQSLLDLKSETP